MFKHDNKLNLLVKIYFAEHVFNKDVESIPKLETQVKGKPIIK